MSTHDAKFDGTPGIGASYSQFQLARALVAQTSNPGPEASARAAERIKRWEQVLTHTMEGSAQYGSRTPFVDVPAWATPEVLTGGFATGRLLAGGDLTESECDLATSIPGVRKGFERLDLNVWHLTEDGLASLQERLARSDYRVDVPEEAALPTVAWLLGQGRTDEARALIEAIAPFFGRLRFFPPAAQGLPVSAAMVQVFRAGEVSRRLAALPPQSRLAAQKRSIEVLLPLYDAAVAHFLRTYAEDWPCRSYPEGWSETAADLCARFDASQRDDVHAVTRSKHRTVELYALLAKCARDHDTLSGRDVGRIRRIVGDFVRKHGLPNSTTHRERRTAQCRQVAAPAHHVIGRAISKRLEAYPSDSGVSDFAALSASITGEEAEVFDLVKGASLPQAIRRRLERCRSGTIPELIEAGLITSGDTIARVLPAMTAEIRGAGFRDTALRTLYMATYRAFRRRRSLLLLNLQSQIGLSELPWVAAVDGERQPDAVSIEAARQALVESSAVTIAAFPHAIVPNKLLQEFRALAKTADLDLPFVDEVAADIFMGTFSKKFLEVARRTSKVIAGTLYARYYAIDTDLLAGLPDRSEPTKPRSWWRRAQSNGDALAMLCALRARAELGTWHPATNGTILEQQQILTTQNLSLLFGDLGLKSTLHPRLSALARTCFEWICARLQMRTENHHARLIMVKNTAYAWRQMVFYLSMLDGAELRSAFDEIEAHFATQSGVFRKRFAPAMLGLRYAVAGHRLPQHETTDEGGRVFLGWSAGSHWLLPTRPESQ